MSRKPANSSRDDGALSESEAAKLLFILGAKYGFSLSRLWQARLKKNPPRSVQKFADTVFRAEGMDPILSNTSLYKQIYGEVEAAFKRSAAGSSDAS